MATASRKYPLLLAWLALCGALGLVLSLLSGLSFFAATVIVAVALVLNGVLAEIEDRAPGGFLNPDGTDTPQWIARSTTAGRWVGIGLMLLVSLVLGVTLSANALTVRAVPIFIALVLAPLLLALCFFDSRRFRWAAWVAAGLFALAITFAVVTT